MVLPTSCSPLRDAMADAADRCCSIRLCWYGDLGESMFGNCRCYRAGRPRQRSHASCILFRWQNALCGADTVGGTQQDAARRQGRRGTAAAAAAAAAGGQACSLCCRGASWRLRSGGSAKGASCGWAQHARGQATWLARSERQRTQSSRRCRRCKEDVAACCRWRHGY